MCIELIIHKPPGDRSCFRVASMLHNHVHLEQVSQLRQLVNIVNRSTYLSYHTFSRRCRLSCEHIHQGCSSRSRSTLDLPRPATHVNVRYVLHLFTQHNLDFELLLQIL